MAVKIKLKRVGKTRQPYYRIVVADARTARGGRAIEEIGLYRPKEDPSFMQVDSERVSYWLSVGAQPTESVTAILKVTGDWQKFKGEPAPEPMKVRAPKADKQAAFDAAAKEAADEPTGDATTAKAKKAPKQAPKQAAVADTTAAAADSADAEPEQPGTVDSEAQAAAAAEPAEGGADTPAADDKPAEA